MLLFWNMGTMFAVCEYVIEFWTAQNHAAHCAKKFVEKV